MDEAERQIYLIWIEIRKLWQEIYDIWGSDGKIPDHNITKIWEKITAIEERLSHTPMYKWGIYNDYPYFFGKFIPNLIEIYLDILEMARSENIVRFDFYYCI